MDEKIRSRMELLLPLLEKEEVEWSVTAVREQQQQVYFIGAVREAVRGVEDSHLALSLFHRTGGGSMGCARCHLLVTDGLREIEHKVRTALAAARRTRSSAWALPGPGGEYPAVEVRDAEEQADPMNALEAGAEEILSTAGEEPGVAASHFEIVHRARQSELRNSRGLTLRGETTDATFHGVLVTEGDGVRYDIKQEMYRRRISDFGFRESVRHAAALARDTLRASLPRSGPTPVVISHSGLDFLLTPVLAHGDGEFHFEKISRFAVGEPIVPEPVAGDRLTLASDGLLPWGIETRPFSPEGLPPVHVPVIEDNVFTHLVASPEFAAGLRTQPTGPFTNRVVAPGTTPMAELTSEENVLHVVEFSALLPDKVSGAFTGEIRMGYQIQNGQRVPVKGGAVSGNLFTALADMTLSEETVFRGDYFGPAAFRFEGLTVSGA